MIIDAKQREERFRKELNEFLERHGAELGAVCESRGYQIGNPYIEVTMDGVYYDGETMLPFAEFTL